MATGTIVQNFPISGSNANGEYVKFPNGTLIQWGYISGIEFSSSDTIKTGTATLPLSFIDTSFRVVASANATSVANFVYRCSASSSAVNKFDWSMAPNTPQYANARGLNWMAIGRWKA